MCGYGLVLSATPTLLPFGVFASFVFICCGTQMLRLTRESEWNGA